MQVRRARRFTPDIADKVAMLTRSNADGALEVFVSAFQREHFELDEAVCDQGFDVWADVAAESPTLLMRGTDRCNGIDPMGFRPGYALQWALIEDVFNGDERTEVIAEVAETFGAVLGSRLEAADPPAHQILRRRLARSPYLGVVAFSRWARRHLEQPHYLDLDPPRSSANVVYMSTRNAADHLGCPSYPPGLISFAEVRGIACCAQRTALAASSCGRSQREALTGCAPGGVIRSSVLGAA